MSNAKKFHRKNKHGLPFIDDYEAQFLPKDETIEDGVSRSSGANASSALAVEETVWEDLSPESFERLLEESFKARKTSRHVPKPMPLKRRLKRYPRPEKNLDLHGFTAIGAEIKARAFITTAKKQGYFTLRIIVGKGRHSEDGPVLPDVIEDLLKILKEENIVLSFQWEGPKKSKSGAIIVYLKQFREY